jgi:hypothetical protein
VTPTQAGADILMHNKKDEGDTGRHRGRAWWPQRRHIPANSIYEKDQTYGPRALSRFPRLEPREPDADPLELLFDGGRVGLGLVNLVSGMRTFWQNMLAKRLMNANPVDAAGAAASNRHRAASAQPSISLWCQRLVFGSHKGRLERFELQMFDCSRTAWRGAIDWLTGAVRNVDRGVQRVGITAGDALVVP